VKTFQTYLNIILLGVIAYLLFKDYSEKQETNQVLSFIDSIDKANDTYFEKIDSLEHIKHEEYRTYEKINLKYDTIQIAIDTMPDLDGTKYLLTISRQLTAKGVE
jgi:hypothetical protein